MKIAVIGAGASGLVAAGSARGAQVTVFDHSEKAGKKIYITGKGRCNFTNVCDTQTFLTNVVTNPRFLQSAISRFTPDDAIKLMEDNGCPTKVERGRRAFPKSDKASDVTKALTAYATKNGARFVFNAHVSDITPCEEGFELTVNGGKQFFDRVIFCTGGKSYPVTGSDGSAFSLLQKLGHSIIPLVPSLVALNVGCDMREAQGLTLKNVTIATDGVKPIFGDLLITDIGISGPIALTLSAYCARKCTPYTVYIDLKPALSEEELDTRILRDFEQLKNKQFKNSLDLLLPKSIIKFIIESSGIDGELRVNAVTRAMRHNLVRAIKHFPLQVTGNGGFDGAVVTSGGVDVKQVSPKTMESKIVGGVYIAGEALDVDALTGGYNFHIALATGFSAGSAITEG